MTPEERAQQLDRWIVMHYGVSKGGHTAYSEILDCLRAALRERDAERAKSLAQAANGVRDAIRRWRAGRFIEPRGLEEAVEDALRALLEEAGK